jgi:sterol desaturase/sphingolipid hydroxylase (fatty acid hydroxylase superfamily)
MPHAPYLLFYAVPGFVLLLVIEAVLAARMRMDLYELPDTASSITMGLGMLLIGLATKPPVFLLYAFLNKFALLHLGYAWWVWILAFFADEFSYYWFHRTSHECRFFWASHVVHHSSQRYNLGTALRQSWTGSLTGWVFWLWMPLVGFTPAMIMTMQSVSLIYQYWVHTEMIRSTGPLENIINTPSHHRVHHGSNPQYIDRNHGGTLIIWDRLFGTFEPEHDRVVYGLTKNIHTYNPIRIAFHEWADIVRDLRHARNWHERRKYVFGRPGWTADDFAASPLADSASGSN